MMEIEESGKVIDLLKKLEDSTPHILWHSFIKKKQSDFFYNERSHSSENCGILQVDFSENYEALFQNEIQSAHWGNKQITVFTAVMRCGPKTVNYALISDNINHDNYAVFTFLDVIFQDVKKIFPELKKVKIFSDGATSQFKQRFNFINLTSIES